MDKKRPVSIPTDNRTSTITESDVLKSMDTQLDEATFVEYMIRDLNWIEGFGAALEETGRELKSRCHSIRCNLKRYINSTDETPE